MVEMEGRVRVGRAVMERGPYYHGWGKDGGEGVSEQRFNVPLDTL